MTMATARPRRRSNQSEASATMGAMVVEAPSRPISSPWARTACQSSTACPAIQKPRPRVSPPAKAMRMAPSRSAKRPIQKLPRPNPTMNAM